MLFQNEVVKKLNNHPYSKCKVVIYKEEKTIKFISYTTEVVVVVYNEDKEEVYLKILGKYSKTTLTQVRWFLNEYFEGLIGKYEVGKLIVIDVKDKNFIKNFK